MSASPSYESGIRPNRTEYIRESTVGVAPSNPAWNLYSDVVREFSVEIAGGVSSQRGRGSPDSQGAYAGTEESSVTIVYDLQQKTASGNTLIDGSGNPNDAITDALQRDSDNRIQNTHTIVDRLEQSDLAAGNTVSGSTSRDTRQYVVVLGAYPDEGTLTGDPSDGQPVAAEISYECEKARRYQVDQPTSSEGSIEIWANSTDANDTTQTLTVESQGAGTTEDLSLNGTTDVQTTATFSDVDALHLDSETAGDVRVYVDDGSGTSKGDQIAEIKGQNSYDHGEGDTGVPALGTGSHASAIGQSYELYHDDEVEQPDGTTIAENFETTEITVSNNVDATNRGGTPRPALSAGDHEVTVDVTVFGETEAVDRVVNHLTTATENVRWTMAGGHVQADSADARDVGEDGLNASESKSMVDVTFNGQGITVSA